MAKLITVIQNDNLINLAFTYRKDSHTESMAGAIIELQMINRATGFSMTRLCTITDELLGECVYVLTADDLALEGNYIAESTITYANGTRLTKQNPFILSVLPQFLV